ncbi:MAG: DUF1643 domain-containing protein [Magnetococcales bacterium]|nr:DUF1643 domain-containing protein [Magnetococcales bacterium]
MINPNSLRAADLKKKFAVFGSFYDIALGGELVACRSVLELLAHDITPQDPDNIAGLKPDLLIVMMNPGSSRPLDKSYEPPLVNRWQDIAKKRQWVATCPDNTQYQIMRVMAALGLQHGRVLNLSDIREPKSPVLFKKISALSTVAGGGVHSIFCQERRKELENLLMCVSCEIPVLVGWGRSDALIPLAKQALTSLSGFSIYGRETSDEKVLFFHPSPMLQRMKEQWVEIMLGQMSIKI